MKLTSSAIGMLASLAALTLLLAAAPVYAQTTCADFSPPEPGRCHVDQTAQYKDVERDNQCYEADGLIKFSGTTHFVYNSSTSSDSSKYHVIWTYTDRGQGVSPAPPQYAPYDFNLNSHYNAKVPGGTKFHSTQRLVRKIPPPTYWPTGYNWYETVCQRWDAQGGFHDCGSSTECRGRSKFDQEDDD